MGLACYAGAEDPQIHVLDNLPRYLYGRTLDTGIDCHTVWQSSFVPTCHSGADFLPPD
jgi:hypothetical protein